MDASAGVGGRSFRAVVLALPVDERVFGRIGVHSPLTPRHVATITKRLFYDRIFVCPRQEVKIRNLAVNILSLSFLYRFLVDVSLRNSRRPPYLPKVDGFPGAEWIRRNSSGAGPSRFGFGRCPQGLFHPHRHSETCALRSCFSLCETIMQRKRK